MDHDYINEHGVVSLYVAGRLSPEERAGFRGSFARGCGTWRKRTRRGLGWPELTSPGWALLRSLHPRFRRGLAPGISVDLWPTSWWSWSGGLRFSSWTADIAVLK